MNAHAPAYDLKSPRVLMVGLDATDADVVLHLAEQGHMPNLARLLRQGQFVRLKSPANLYAGGVWPTFYTGRPVAAHGLFHSKLWRQSAMRVEAPTREWVPAQPFWERFAAHGIPVCVIDVPMVLGEPNPVDGVVVNGWATHDLIHTGSWPPSLWAELQRRYGPPRMAPEKFGAQTRRTLAGMSRMLCEATKQQLALATGLLSRQTWQFGCVVFGATHRIGHYLWRHGAGTAACLQAQSDVAPEVIEVYAEVDQALGELVAQATPDTMVAAFAVHGMGANSGWSDLFPDILAEIQRHNDAEPPSMGLLYRLRRRVPHRWTQPVLAALPGATRRRLTELWSAGMFDWSRTRYFPVPMDAAGYVRVNLAGRERLGTVTPDAYDGLCDALERLIVGLVDSATGQPIASTVHRPYRDADPLARARDLLPDLVVEFDGPSAVDCTRLANTALPEFEFKVPRRLPSGRSGNHTDGAWLLARGRGIPAGAASEEHSVLDLLPTVLAWLGQPKDPGLPGHAIAFGACD